MTTFAPPARHAAGGQRRPSIVEHQTKNGMAATTEEIIIARLEDIKRYTLLGAKKVLNVDDVALLLGVSKDCVYRLAGSRKLPHYKPNGKAIYFHRDEIEAYMLSNRVTPMDEIEQQAREHCARH